MFIRLARPGLFSQTKRLNQPVVVRHASSNVQDANSLPSSSSVSSTHPSSPSQLPSQTRKWHRSPKRSHRDEEDDHDDDDVLSIGDLYEKYPPKHKTTSDQKLDDKPANNVPTVPSRRP